MPLVYSQNTESGAAKSPTPVAAVPFKGSGTGDDDIINQFGQVMRQALPKVGPYTAVPVDMNNLPPDVPEGGFPPYVCPSPSMAQAPYALTGELNHNDDDGMYHLRLYLWEMATNRLLCSDELAAVDRAGCEVVMPSLLGWLFSWLKPPDPPQKEAEVPPQKEEPRQEEPRKNEPEKWLYVGLRAGPSLRFYSRKDRDPFIEDRRMHIYNLNIAVQAAVHTLPFLDIQGEIIWNTEYAPFAILSGTTVKTAPFTSMSMMFPLVVKYTIRKDIFHASVLGGGYFILPLGNMKNDAHGGSFAYSLNLPLGYTLGFSMGIKAGPGSIFFDMRWAADLSEMRRRDTGEVLYKRSMIVFTIGYEMGFFEKKKLPAEPSPAPEKDQ
ncbi:MAG: hypothetical protein LBG84_03255 [Treponema sp.]|nr:hypothetical protein [Treponema sp.]